MILDVEQDFLDLVLLELESVPIALLSHQVLALAPTDKASADLPLLSDWLGLANTLKYDMAQLSAIASNQSVLRWRVPLPVQLIQLPVADLYALPPLLALAHGLRGLAALAWYQQRLIFIVDLSLVDSAIANL